MKRIKKVRTSDPQNRRTAEPIIYDRENKMKNFQNKLEMKNEKMDTGLKDTRQEIIGRKSEVGGRSEVVFGLKLDDTLLHDGNMLFNLPELKQPDMEVLILKYEKILKKQSSRNELFFKVQRVLGVLYNLLMKNYGRTSNLSDGAGALHQEKTNSCLHVL